MKNTKESLTKSIMFALIMIGSLTKGQAQSWSNWSGMTDNYRNELSYRHYTNENTLMASNYHTGFEVHNGYDKRVYFKISFTYAEGRTQSWDWNLDPDHSYTWDLDIRRIVSYNVKIYQYKDTDGKFYKL